MTDRTLLKARWRVGRKVGRTVYAMVGAKPSGDDVLIGVMDSEALARDAVGAHNTRLTKECDTK
jgi:hypothetical protein